MRKTLWIASALAAALSACSPSKVVHNKTYFAARDGERATTLAACHNNPGLAPTDANCVNALAAQVDVDRKKAWTISPPASRQSDPGKL
jgi:hypothetical protein